MAGYSEFLPSKLTHKLAVQQNGSLPNAIWSCCGLVANWKRLPRNRFSCALRSRQIPMTSCRHLLPLYSRDLWTPSHKQACMKTHAHTHAHTCRTIWKEGLTSQRDCDWICEEQVLRPPKNLLENVFPATGPGEGTAMDPKWSFYDTSRSLRATSSDSWRPRLRDSLLSLTNTLLSLNLPESSYLCRSESCAWYGTLQYDIIWCNMEISLREPFIVKTCKPVQLLHGMVSWQHNRLKLIAQASPCLLTRLRLLARPSRDKVLDPK